MKQKLMSVKEAIIMAMSEEMRMDENDFDGRRRREYLRRLPGTSVGMLEEFDLKE